MNLACRGGGDGGRPPNHLGGPDGVLDPEGLDVFVVGEGVGFGVGGRGLTFGATLEVRHADSRDDAPFGRECAVRIAMQCSLGLALGLAPSLPSHRPGASAFAAKTVASTQSVLLSLRADELQLQRIQSGRHYGRVHE